MLMRNAFLDGHSYLEASANPAFDIGSGDFSLSLMFSTIGGGPLVSRLAPGHAGFLLSLTADSQVMFQLSDGTTTLTALAAAPGSRDGGCHWVQVVRQSGVIRIVMDGKNLAVSCTPAGAAPRGAVSDLPLQIGVTAVSGQAAYLAGTIMNVSLWGVALAGDRAVAAAFGRVSASDPGLRGCWCLDGTTDDRSPNHNSLRAVGSVGFKPCVDCVYLSGPNHYEFCQMSSTPSPHDAPEAGEITLVRSIDVPAGTPALFASVLSGDDVPSFPAGVSVMLTDPSAHTYRTDVNTENVFVLTRGGQPWAVTIINPMPGPWRLAVAAPATTTFVLQFQTCPAADVVGTVTSVLRPVYGHAGMAPHAGVAPHAADQYAWLDTVAKIAVAVLVGVAVAAVLVVLSGGTAVPAAVAAGVAAFAVISTAKLSSWLPEADTTSVQRLTVQFAGMTGLVVAPDGVLLIDANADTATQRQYEQRKAMLYPAVTGSPFNKKQQSLIGPDDTRAKVSSALRSFGRYVSIAGHGQPSYVMGYYEGAPGSPLQEILTVGKYDPAEVRGKIIHIVGCDCGSPLMNGLGRNVAEVGALAFFGYSVPFALIGEFAKLFMQCDIEIDKAMLSGKTCDEAYWAAKAMYNRVIRGLRDIGRDEEAAWLESNRDHLVAPTTNPVFGYAAAKLDTGLTKKEL
jgi:concanavalin A-like lectin/glucanase superfamily protein